MLRSEDSIGPASKAELVVPPTVNDPVTHSLVGASEVQARSRRALVAFLVAFVLLNGAAWWSHGYLEQKRLAELLVDAQVRQAGTKPRFDHSVGESLEHFWRFIPDARQQRLAILVGMSQMYAFNDPKPGDLTVAERLDDMLAPQGTRVFGLAAPNLNNEEALLYLLATAQQPQTKPQAFVYGVCFDKFRNTDLRPGLQNFARRRPELLDAWKDVAARYMAKYPRAAEKMLASLNDLQTTGQKAADDAFESKLRRAVARGIPVVAARQALSAEFLYRLYRLRNWVFGIKASSKRPIIGARYDLNREFLEILATEAQARGITFLPYVIPLNPIAGTPYVESEYADFKSWLQAFAQSRGLHLAQLENVVPKNEWGLRAGEPDFKHFNSRGHLATAKAVAEAFHAELVANRP